MFPTTMSYNFVFVVYTMIFPTQVIYILAILINSYIKTIIDLIYKDLIKNMFVITICTNATKVLNLRNKVFFSRY